MKNNSFLSGIKGLFKEMLYMESENTNIDREKIVEVDKYGNKTTYYKAAAGPDKSNDMNNTFK